MQVPILKVLSDRQVSKRDDVLLDLLVYQWSLAEELVKVLGPFEVATTMFSAEYNVSLSCVLPIMDGLRNSDDLPEISDFKQVLAEQMRKKFNIETLNPLGLPMVASFLDPRFKSSTFLLEDSRPEARQHVVSLVQQQVSLQHPPSQSRSEQERTEGDPCSLPTAKKPCTSAWDIISVIFAEQASTSAEQTAESVEDEVFRYMSAISPSRNTNPLNWWKHHQYFYTRL